MPTPPSSPPSPVEFFKGLVRRLGDALTTKVMAGRIAPAIAALINLRIALLRDRFAELAERVAAGKYRARPEPETKTEPEPEPENAAPRAAPANPAKPPQCEKLFLRRGWLAALLPEQAPACRAYLRDWFQTPAMVALMAAAPKPMANIIRPLCWALKYTPPAALKAPRRRPRPKPPRPARPEPEPEPELPRPALLGPDYRPSAQWPRGVLPGKWRKKFV